MLGRLPIVIPLDGPEFCNANRFAENPYFQGACAMTTKLINYYICTFKNCIVITCPKKNSVLDDFPLCPQCGRPTPSLTHTNFNSIVVPPSLIFITFERFARIISNLRFATFCVPKGDSQKRVQFRNPQAIRANQAIVMNLRIDSRKSGLPKLPLQTSSRKLKLQCDALQHRKKFLKAFDEA